MKILSLLLNLTLTFQRMSQKTMMQLFYNEIQIRGGYSAKLKMSDSRYETQRLCHHRSCALYLLTQRQNSGVNGLHFATA